MDELSERAAGMQRAILDVLPDIAPKLQQRRHARELIERIYAACQSDAFTTSLRNDPHDLDDLSHLTKQIVQTKEHPQELLPALRDYAVRLRSKEPLTPFFGPLPGPIIIDDDEEDEGSG